MSKKRHLFQKIFSVFKSIFKKKKSKLKVERNIFGDFGELEMIEYSKMILFIRNYYIYQNQMFGHTDYHESMVKLSKMSYVEVKALFAAILEIQAKSNDSFFNKFDYENRKINSI